jgi:protein-L-isoaspartate(D-aspartate) O-methyltransferase|uniref:Protein-L-isoaspartate O-methyltransferase n=1 Tax=Desulfobacca acetoxidans TaxID=60893 RepID=A0A7V6A1I6_9BACT
MPEVQEDSFREARQAMVETQIRRRGVLDSRVLAAMAKVPRHRFIPRHLWEQAYSDYPLPIGEEQTISQPYIVALMTEALELTGPEKVLELGTGSGYQAAILAELAAQVFTIERIPALARTAQQVLASLGYANVQVIVADGTLGWPGEAPFDAILVTAGSPQIPPPLVDQLAMGGRLVIPVGDRYSQILTRVRRTPEGLKQEYLGGCRFVKLIGRHGWQAETAEASEY